MNDPCLIQSGAFRDTKTFTGIDDLIRLEYMGAAEYEFGALPNSLKAMCKNIDSYGVFESTQSTHMNENLYIVCKAGDVADINKIIKGLIARKYRIKCACQLDRVTTPPSVNCYNKLDFWWDIDQDYMITIGRAKACQLVDAIRLVRERKKSENKNDWF